MFVSAASFYAGRLLSGVVNVVAADDPAGGLSPIRLYASHGW
jgi:hypothetical protein